MSIPLFLMLATIPWLPFAITAAIKFSSATLREWTSAELARCLLGEITIVLTIMLLVATDTFAVFRAAHTETSSRSLVVSYKMLHPGAGGLRSNLTVSVFTDIVAAWPQYTYIDESAVVIARPTVRRFTIVEGTNRLRMLFDSDKSNENALQDAVKDIPGFSPPKTEDLLLRFHSAGATVSPTDWQHLQNGEGRWTVRMNDGGKLTGFFEVHWEGGTLPIPKVIETPSVLSLDMNIESPKVEIDFRNRWFTGSEVWKGLLYCFAPALTVTSWIAFAKWLKEHKERKKRAAKLILP